MDKITLVEALDNIKNLCDGDDEFTIAYKTITRYIRDLENEELQLNTILEWIYLVLDGNRVSDFALSFPLVRMVYDKTQELEHYKTLCNKEKSKEGVSWKVFHKVCWKNENRPCSLSNFDIGFGECSEKVCPYYNS